MTVSAMRGKTHYVLGFAMDEDAHSMLLITKDHPEPIHGLVSGLGGRKTAWESPVQAMVRTFKKECGIETTKDDWHHFHNMEGIDYIVHCYVGSMNLDGSNLGTEEEEVLRWDIIDFMGWKGIDIAAHRLEPALRYLIPMAIESERVRLQRF